MKSPAMWAAGMGTWLITALASINIGLEAFNMSFATTMWMDYIIGFSGLFSLGMMVMTLMYGCTCGVCGMCTDKKPSGNMGGGNTGGSMGGQNVCSCGKQRGQCGCGK